ncbi:hypothetical protein NP233_g1141 [Leucocoprinus birnbaumii]|uniref:Nephrocystin 3-like N-terminal domain-containing protein n=1 Tax=Leucocoprinus birnbaumii TaxID=56174 RepID=A0AAD5W0W5_9AGAR|nr:hypothetical protein NP233_g1141 [Leucocoprinus birnbaumii]
MSSRPSLATDGYKDNHALSIDEPGGAFYGAHDFMLLNPIFKVSTRDAKKLKILARTALTAAEYNSSERDPPPSCHPGTRLEISEEIRALANDAARTLGLLWVYGPAGVGKSAIMQTIAETCTSILGATFFFFKAKGLTDPRRLFITIAYRLALQYPCYRNYIVKLLAQDPQIVKRSTKEQFRLLISEPVYRDRVFESLEKKVLIIIDGLDECEGIDAQCEIISLIGRALGRHPKSPLFWAIASRQETHIKGTFADLPQNTYQRLEIPMDSDQACREVELYLNDRFQQIRRKYTTNFSFDESWPCERDFSLIAGRARGMFIFAKLVADFVGDHHYADPISLLERVLRVIEHSSPSDTNPFHILDALYTEILSAVPAEMLPTVYRLLWRSLKSNRYTPSFLVDCNFWGIRQTEAYAAFDKLHSILLVPDPMSVDGRQLSPYHRTFIDYLENPLRSGTFTISPNDLQVQVFERALYILNQSCDIVTSSINVEQCILSWPLNTCPTELNAVDLRWQIVFKAFREIVHSVSLSTGCELFDREVGIDKLSNFFHYVDMGTDFARLVDPYQLHEDDWFDILFRIPLKDSFRSWGLLKSIPLESFDFMAIRQDCRGLQLELDAGVYDRFPEVFVNLCSGSLDEIKELIPSSLRVPKLQPSLLSWWWDASTWVLKSSIFLTLP